MAEVKEQYQKLPPGWDCKFDQATGNCYYINYLTKAMQLEDPRSRYKQLQNERCSNESIAMQPVHGSPYHVYPSNNMPAMRAFQAGPGTNTSLHNMSSSPLLSSRGHLEMSPLPVPRSSLTQTPRLGNMSRRSTIQETSFTNPIDTDAVVNKIQNMFPTASGDHIRLLLKKYYNREAVVISALQVEKHPVTMPGPYVTPPAQRHLYHSNSAFHMTPPARRLDMGISARNGPFAALNGSVTAGYPSRTASPIPGGRFGSVTSVHSGVGSGGGGYMAAAATAAMPFHQGTPRFEQYRASPKPHSSPKMKLRYMKTIFPKADEMILLDILASSDNNVQTASEKLISMGYTKRDFIPPKTTHRFDAEAAKATALKKLGDETIIPLRPKEYNAEEKAAIQAHLKEKYPQIAERIILMALESVNYAEDRAIQILHIVQEEDELQAKKQDVSLKTSGADAEVVLGASGIAHALSNDHATIDDSIITIVLKTPLNSADINSRHNASNKHLAQSPPPKSISSSTPRSSSESSSTSLSSSSSASVPQNSFTTRNLKSSTKIQAAKNIIKKVAFPSINLITPTTATTQVILSNSPTKLKQSDAVDAIQNLTTCSTSEPPSEPFKEFHISHDQSSNQISSSASALSSSKPLDVDSTKYQGITTKSILARCNMYASGIHGYLHGTNYENKKSVTTSTASGILEKLKLTRLREQTNSLKAVRQEGDVEGASNVKTQQAYKSIIERIPTNGHCADLSKGADESLLLADYVTWNGANPNIPKGNNQRQLAQGADVSMLSERSCTAIGRNAELCKGAQKGLAKGSIYAQLAASANTNTNNIKCN